MKLKRDYELDDDGELVLSEDGKPILTSVRMIQHSKTQKFTPNFVNQALADGLISMMKNQIVMHTVPELTYKIVRIPGYYCCFDNKRLSGEAQAKKYVDDHFSDQKSPDSSHPAGYRKDNFFFCELVEEQVNG